MRIGFIGAGSMAAAMARGWKDAEGGPESMLFSDAGSGRAAAVAAEVGGEGVERASELAGRADLLVLAVKRTALDDVAREVVAGGDVPPVLSLLAGVPLAALESALPGVPVLRAMPNLAVEVRRGTVCYVPPPASFPPDAADDVVAMLDLLGTVVPVEERLIDAAMAVMSCSPAYLAMVSEAIADAGAAEGLDPGLAHELVVDTMAGTAELLRERDPATLQAAVASPGGATEAGLATLEGRETRAAVAEAVRASLGRMRG